MEQQTQTVFEEERMKLEAVSAEIDRQLAGLSAAPRYRGHDFTEQALEASRESARRTLAVATAEPYFGRLDFAETGQDRCKQLYIGKNGVQNDANVEPLVIDWRAPIASLFYSFTGGDLPAAYDSPDGTIEGLVYLKRNLVIRKAILQRVVDTYDRNSGDMAVTDEFLLYRLGENKDNRLRDIVSTIQAEQDRIIRAGRNTSLIIQGVAGSGKTTVALHRLAYLLYQYRENVRAERMIIFAPNGMFLDYISGVLPELGVGNIRQTTFADWALDMLEHEVKLKNPAESLDYWFAAGSARPVIDERTPGRYKGSIAFKTLLEKRLTEYEAHIVPHADYEAWEGAVLPEQTVREWFYAEYKHDPVLKRYNRIVARIKRWLDMQLGKGLPTAVRKEKKKKADQRLRAYLNKWTVHTTLSFYRQLFDDPTLFKKKEVQMEDLAPLVRIRDFFYGIPSSEQFDHTVIDEAQDFSPFQVALLEEHTRNQSFTILGDLSQAIHAYQGIVDWSELRGLFAADQSAYFQLERSYRSTMEIIHFANAVLTAADKPVSLAVPVFRSGKPVAMGQVAQDERIGAIVRAVGRAMDDGAATVAIVARTAAASAVLHAALAAAGLSATLITPQQQQYEGGISVLPIYMTKGLEFDAVIFVDVDKMQYERTSEDAKLLYVGCTRALHQLVVFYCGEPSPLLSEVPEPLYTSIS